MNTLEASKVEQFHVQAWVEQVHVCVHELQAQVHPDDEAGEDPVHKGSQIGFYCMSKKSCPFFMLCTLFRNKQDFLILNENCSQMKFYQNLKKLHYFKINV